MPWIVVLTGRDLPNAEPADEDLRFALGEGIALTDDGYVPGGLLRWSSPSQRIEISEAGSTRSTADEGEVLIANIARDYQEAGPWDSLLDWAWQARPALLYWLPGTVWADKVLSGRGVLEQPESGGDSLHFTLRDPRADLDAALQPLKYGGTNVAPDGVDGTADLKGKPRPIVEGTVSQFPGRLVNYPKLVWELHCGDGLPLCVRDGGIPLTLGTIRANVASLLANAPEPGGYDYTAGSGGTYVRLGSLPALQVLFDVQVGATEADRTHAQIWNRLRTERCGTDAGDIDSASVTAVDVLADKEAGFAWTEETTRREALDRVLASLSGFEVQTLAGEWAIGRVEAPSGTPDVALAMATPDSAFTATGRQLLGTPGRVWPSYAPTGSPPYRVNVLWGRNHTVMQPADFAGYAAQRLKDKFSREWRTETSTNDAIWKPSDNTGAFPGAPELNIETGYQPGADGITCPHAEDEADDRLALYGALPMKAQYEAGFVPEPGDELLPGMVAQLTYPRFGLNTGPLFLVLQARLTVEREEPQGSLLLGLQT